MGKRYHCDYCNKTMSAAPAIVKTHNKGIVHQKLVNQHYQQFKDPETILAEEANKKPCSRFAAGACHFGSICRFSHYSKEEMESLEECVTSKNGKDTIKPLLSFHDIYQKLQDEKAKSEPNRNTTTMVGSDGITHVFPWVYNDLFESYGNLPPSLKRMKLEDFRNADITEWG